MTNSNSIQFTLKKSFLYPFLCVFNLFDQRDKHADSCLLVYCRKCLFLKGAYDPIKHQSKCKLKTFVVMFSFVKMTSKIIVFSL